MNCFYKGLEIQFFLINIFEVCLFKVKNPLLTKIPKNLATGTTHFAEFQRAKIYSALWYSWGYLYFYFLYTDHKGNRRGGTHG